MGLLGGLGKIIGKVAPLAANFIPGAGPWVSKALGGGKIAGLLGKNLGMFGSLLGGGSSIGGLGKAIGGAMGFGGIGPSQFRGNQEDMLRQLNGTMGGWQKQQKYGQGLMDRYSGQRDAQTRTALDALRNPLSNKQSTSILAQSEGRNNQIADATRARMGAGMAARGISGPLAQSGQMMAERQLGGLQAGANGALRNWEIQTNPQRQMQAQGLLSGMINEGRGDVNRGLSGQQNTLQGLFSGYGNMAANDEYNDRFNQQSKQNMLLGVGEMLGQSGALNNLFKRKPRLDNNIEDTGLDFQTPLARQPQLGSALPSPVPDDISSPFLRPNPLGTPAGGGPPALAPQPVGFGMGGGYNTQGQNLASPEWTGIPAIDNALRNQAAQQAKNTNYGNLTPDQLQQLLSLLNGGR